MSTFNSTSTHAHNVTYVTDQINSSLLQLITLLGLKKENLLDSWESKERAIKTWLYSGHLETVVLEIYDPLDPNYAAQRWDMEIDYDTDCYIEDLGRWKNKDAIAAAVAKFGIRRTELEFRVILMTKNNEPSVEGWSSTVMKNTEKLSRSHFGTTAGSSSVNVNTSVWR